MMKCAGAARESDYLITFSVPDRGCPEAATEPFVQLIIDIPDDAHM